MNAGYTTLDSDQRPAEPPPPVREGYRTMPGRAPRTGLPETIAYRYQHGENVLTPAEIVAQLRQEIISRWTAEDEVPS